MTNYTSITFDLRDRVAVITLNRPDKANGINLALATKLVQAAFLVYRHIVIYTIAGDTMGLQ